MGTRTVVGGHRAIFQGRGAGGGWDGSGGGLPDMPDGEDLWAFVRFVYELLEYWTRQGIRNDAFNDLHDDLKTAIDRGWIDFADQWARHSKRLQSALSKLKPADRARRGLFGPALQMKLHLVRKHRETLVMSLSSIRAISRSVRQGVRGAWHKLFAAIDIVLDSVLNALALVPVAGSLASGLKEFKEFSMEVSTP